MAIGLAALSLPTHAEIHDHIGFSADPVVLVWTNPESHSISVSSDRSHEDDRPVTGGRLIDQNERPLRHGMRVFQVVTNTPFRIDVRLDDNERSLTGTIDMSIESIGRRAQISGERTTWHGNWDVNDLIRQRTIFESEIATARTDGTLADQSITFRIGMPIEIAESLIVEVRPR